MNTLEKMLRELGHDEDYEPTYDPAMFLPTRHPAGSREKLDVMRRRIERGEPLWHEHDSQECELGGSFGWAAEGFDGPHIRVCSVRTERKRAAD